MLNQIQSAKRYKELKKRVNSMARDASSAELSDIKKLLIMQLVSRGVKQGDIAAALDVSAAKISRMFPKGVLDSVRNADG